MSERATVLVLGRRRTDNMPSLTRMQEILRPASATVPGMDATIATAHSMRITGTGVVEPMMGKCWSCGKECSGIVCDECNKGPDVVPATANTIYPCMGGCPMGGACVADPVDQAKVDQCPEC